MAFFEPGKALEALRKSSFDNLSAYAEVIDNSIQAEAENIKIHFFLKPQKGNYEEISELVFGDDGIGMNVDTLNACLKLGWSSRYNDREGIGRFGVGMVLGAIHECKRIEVYSKQADNEWYYTYIDLEEIESGDLKDIPVPIKKQVPARYQGFINNQHGTLVIWSKYDRQKESGHLIIDEAKHYFGRTFRKFIWDANLTISVNEEEIKAFDPLYVRTEKTKFPNDPQAKLYESITFDWPIPEDIRQQDELPKSEITIRMSLIPEKFRPVQGSGGSSEAKERKINENQGVSIIRNKREVFYGEIPLWSRVKIGDRSGNSWSFEEKDRWWGCEIDFEALLDDCFDVKNIKRGADPEIELKRKIKALITPTRTSVLNAVDEVWNKAKIKANIENEDLKRTDHTRAEKAAQKANKKVPKTEKGGNIEDALKNIEKNVLSNADETQRKKYLELFEKQPFTIHEDSWKGSLFWEITHGGGHSLLSYNLAHIFFDEYYDAARSLAEKNDPTAKKFKDLIDLLLISAAKAQGIQGGDEMSIDLFNNQWGTLLQVYINSWREETKDD